MLKRVDKFGRITIPRDVRHELEIGENEPMDMIILKNNGDKQILLKHYDIRCDVCGCKENLDRFNNIVLCKDCISQIKKELN